MIECEYSVQYIITHTHTHTHVHVHVHTHTSRIRKESFSVTPVTRSSLGQRAFEVARLAAWSTPPNVYMSLAIVCMYCMYYKLLDMNNRGCLCLCVCVCVCVVCVCLYGRVKYITRIVEQHTFLLGIYLRLIQHKHSSETMKTKPERTKKIKLK